MNEQCRVVDPVEFAAKLWPHVTLCDYQKDILYSVRDNDESYIVSANMMGS